MSNASQIQAQQNMSPTFHHSQTCFKINLNLFMRNGRPNKKISSHIAGVNLCIVYGNSYLMMTFYMLTNMGLWCKAQIR